MTTPRQWVIGRAPDCDLVIDQPEVSARHCRLTEAVPGFVLEDLQSANGTYVNGQRLSGPVPVTPADRVTLGQKTPMPWPAAGNGAAAPAPSPGATRIGRAPDNDVVLDYPGVSAHHARLWREGGQVWIEDLGSTNGTAVGRPENKVPKAPLSEADVVYLGSLPVPAARLLAGRLALGKQPHEAVAFRGTAMTFGRHPDCDQVLNYPMISARHARLSRVGGSLVLEDLGSTNGTFVNGRRVAGPVPVKAGDAIGLGSFVFTLTGSGDLEKRDFRGNLCLEARGITVEVPRKRLIEDISLTIYPSEIVGLMGPSGAGKTTLLSALNGYLAPSRGAVLLNGQDLYRHFQQFRTCIGYVPQDDVLHHSLTVGQALYYSARLRLPADYSRADVARRIAVVLDQLGLTGTEGVLIGSPEKKGISGGQRKRVNLAMELLADPLVLFLDEPTSGLSSEDALLVMKVLRGLADAGKTILITIHQPNLEVFRLMDNLALVAKDPRSADPGRLSYYGPAYPAAVEFFNPDGVPGLRPGSEPSPDEVLRGLARRPTAEWVARYRVSPYCREYVQERSGGEVIEAAAAPPPAAPPAPSWWRQFRTLAARNLALKASDRMNTFVLLVQAPLIGSLFYALFRSKTLLPMNEENGLKISYALAQALFLLVLAALWFGASAAVREVVGEWAVYRRERMVNLRISTYVAAKLAVLGALGVLQCAILLAIAYWSCGLKGPWLAMYGVLVLVALVGVALGLVISAVARTSEVAIGILPIILLVLVMLGGVLVRVVDMGPLVHLADATPIRWGFEGMLLLEKDGHDTFVPLDKEMFPLAREVTKKLVAQQAKYFREKVGQKLDTMGFQLPEEEMEKYVQEAQEKALREVEPAIRTAAGKGPKQDVADYHFPHDQRSVLTTPFLALAGTLVVLVALFATTLRLRDTR